VRGDAPPGRDAGRRVRRTGKPPARPADAERPQPRRHEPRPLRGAAVTAAALRIPRLVWADASVLRWVAASRLLVLGAFLALFVVGPVGVIGPRFYGWPLQLLGAWDGVWY